MLESLALLARQLVIIFYCDKSLTVNQHVLIIPVTKQESYSNAACCQKKKKGKTNSKHEEIKKCNPTILIN